MISSQLGTDARPRVFFTGLREGGSWVGSSSAASSTSSASDPETAGVLLVSSASVWSR